MRCANGSSPSGRHRPPSRRQPCPIRLPVKPTASAAEALGAKKFYFVPLLPGVRRQVSPGSNSRPSSARSGRLDHGLVRHGERDAVKQLLADDPGFLRRPNDGPSRHQYFWQQIGRPLWAYVVARILSAQKRINILDDAKQTARGRRASGSKSWCGSCQTGEGASIWRRLLARDGRGACAQGRQTMLEPFVSFRVERLLRCRNPNLWAI